MKTALRLVPVAFSTSLALGEMSYVMLDADIDRE